MKRLRKKVYSVLAFLLVVTMVDFGIMPAATVKAEESIESTTGMVYYVDSVKGGDTNEGTSETEAWKTLDKVNAKEFQPGDKILFKRGGVWNGLLWAKGSGEEGSPIVIDTYGDESANKPIINGVGTSTTDPENETGEGAAVFLFNQSYWEINNLEVTNTTYAKDEVRAHRTGVRVLAKDAGTVSHIYLKNVDVHDVHGDYTDPYKRSGGIQFNISGSTTPTKYNDILVECCTVKNVSRTGIQIGVSSWRNRYGYTNGAGEWYPSTNVKVRNCFVDTIGGDGILTRECEAPLIEYNVAKDCNYDGQTANVAIWPWNSDDAVLQYNEAYNTRSTIDGQGFDSDFLCNNTTIQYNYSHDNEGGFILICSPDSNQRNVNSVVRYNISENDHYQVFRVQGPATENTMIYNNTIYLGEELKGEGVQMVSNAQWGGYNRNTYYSNNIFYNLAEASYDLRYSTNNVFENNCFVGGPLPEESSQVKVEDSNLVMSAEESGQVGFAGPVGTGETVIDFHNADRLSGYKLKADSACINKGKMIDDNGGLDFWGNALYSGDPDIGAFEYQDESFVATPEEEEPEETRYRYECEDLTYTASVGAGMYKDNACSEGENLSLFSEKAGETIEFTLNVPTAGSYEVCVGTKRAANKGKFVSYVEGLPTGLVQDTYSDANSFPKESLGTVYFAEGGDKVFKFETTGKNSSSSGYNVSFDYIELIFQGVGRFECENLEKTSSTDKIFQISKDKASGGWLDDCQFETNNGNYVEYTLPDVSAGKYQVKVGVQCHNNKGIYTLSIDGVQQEKEQDQWYSGELWTVHEFGEVEFTESGDRTFRFDLTGKNTESKGYSLMFDYILLEPVTEGTLVRIQMTSPEKQQYEVGEELDLSGIEVTAVYSDGTTKTVDLKDCDISDFDSASTGEKTVTIAYENKTLSFKVVVKESGTYECEDLSATTFQGTRSQGSIVTGASGGKADSLENNGLNSYIEYTVPAVEAGTYKVRINIRSHSNKGIYQLSIDGRNQGEPQDQYTSSGQLFEQDLGEVVFDTSGDKSFRFTVTGKNGESTNYCLMFDYILLERVFQ